LAISSDRMVDFFRRLSPWQATLGLVFFSSFLRLVTSTGVGLGTDEAHYALYGFHLDISYYDHPPMIGWLQAIILLFSDSDLALRVMPTLLFGFSCLALHQVTHSLFSHKTPWLGFISVVLLQSGVMFQLIGLSMLPDDPLLLLGLLTMLVLHQILNSDRMWLWLALGIVLGLAGLSKYTAISLVATVLLVMVHEGKLLSRMCTAGPWIAMLTGLLLIMPVLYWNYTHDWISFAYQLNHGTGNPDWKPINFALSQFSQLLVYGPGILFFGVISAVASLRNWRDQGVWLCLALSFPILFLFGWNSGYQMTLPHWTSLGWAALIPLISLWLSDAWEQRWVRISIGASAIYASILIVILLSEFFLAWIPFSNNRDPLRDLRGWEKAAQRAVELRDEMVVTLGPEPYLFLEHWTEASRLAWYARPNIVKVLDEKYDQFDIWFDSPQQDMRGILVSWPEQRAPLTGGKGQFSSCVLRDTLPIIVNGHEVSTFSYYACHGFQN